MAVTQVPSHLIKDGAVTASKIGAQAVENAKIKDAAVTAAKLATDSVETAKIKNLAVTAGKIATGAVSGDKIAEGGVGQDEIADQAVGTAELQDEAVTGDKVSPTDRIPEEKLELDRPTQSLIQSAVDMQQEVHGSAKVLSGQASRQVFFPAGVLFPYSDYRVVLTRRTPYEPTLTGFYVSDKLAGSFKVNLSSAESQDVEFDYIAIGAE